MTPPFRILMTADAVGGVWSYCLTLAEALGARATILLAVLGPPPTPAQRAAAASVAGLNLVDRPYRLEWMPNAVRDVRRSALWLESLAAEFHPHVIHVNGYAAAVARWHAPVIVAAHSCVLSWWHAVHGTAAPDEWAAYAGRVRRGLAASERIVAPTRAMLEAVERHYGPQKNARVIWNGVRLERFAPATKEKIVLAAGRLWDEAKNLAALDRAAARSRWPIIAAGSCQGPDGIEKAPRHLTALGPLQPAQLADWMGRAAIFTAPARYEPFGLGVLEAAASGCALVLGDIASLRELWDGAARFVAPGDHAALASSIDELMREDRAREALAAAARTRAQRYAASRMADRYSELYSELTRPIFANGA